MSASPRAASPPSHTDIQSARFRHIAYLQCGSPAAPALFLLHGGTMTARWNWADAMPVFARQFRVIAPDSPGHGESANPRGRLRYEEMAEDILELAGELGIEHAFLYGFSDGAQTALELAMRAPAFPRALVLSAVLHRLTADYRARMLEFAGAEGFAEPAWSASQPELAAQCRRSHAQWSVLAAQVWELWNRPLRLPRERLRLVSAPTLLLSGDRDRFVALERTVELLRRLPDAELAVIPGAGHECDERFTRSALEFLARRGA